MSQFITEVRADGLKGRTFTHQLGPKVLIAGPNWTGKTSILDAITVALAGCKASLGETNTATMLLASGKEMTVRVKTSAGLIFSRAFKRTSNGVSQQKQLPEGVDASSLLLTPKEYFDLNAREQVDLVFRIAPQPEGYGPARVLEEIEKLRMGDDMTQAAEEGVDMVLKWAEEAMSGVDLRAALTSLTEDKKGKLSAEYTRWNRERNLSAGGTAKLQDMAAEETNPVKPATVEAKISTANAKLLTLQNELGGLLERQRAAEKQAETRRELEELIAQPSADYAGDIAKWEARAEALRAELVPVTEPDIAGPKAELAKLHAAGLAAAKARDAATARVAQLSELGICAKCKAKLIDPLKEEETNMEAERTALAEQWDTLRAEITALEKQAKANIPVQRRNAEIQAELEDIAGSIEDIRKAIAQDAEELDAARKQLAAMPGATEQVDTDRVAKIQADASELNAELASLRAELRDALASEARLAAENSARTDHRRERDIAEIIQKAKQSLLRLQAEMVGKVFAGLLDAANEIGGSLLKTPLAYLQDQVGRLESGHFIPYDTFTESEQALAAISISAALSEHAPIRLLMLDEMGTMSGKLQGAVLHRLAACVDAGKLDQVICVMPRDSTPAAPGDWRMITTTAETKGAAQ